MSWNINKSELIDYTAGSWAGDYFFTSPDNKYGVIVYNIEEYKMGAYFGLIGIYSNPDKPQLELNSSLTRIHFQHHTSFNFLEKSGCIVCRKPSHRWNESKGGFPFIIINLRKKKFAFYDFDITSIHYGLEEVEINKARIFEVHPKELRYLFAKKRSNEIIDLEKLKWFNLIDFDRALQKYAE